MLNFKPIELSDRDWINEALKQCDYMSCEYSFGNYFVWKETYDLKVAHINDYYTAALTDGDLTFLYPAGTGDIKPVIEAMIEYCASLDIPFRMFSLNEKAVAELEAAFPGRFDIEPVRDYFDYVYLQSDLAELGGKRYHGKRNHIARFKEQNWSFEPITSDNIDECFNMNKEWCILNDCEHDEHKQREAVAIERCVKYFEQLDMFGGLLRVDGRVVAFTIGERLNSNTVVVHFEKAFADMQGAYPTINNEFVINMAADYKYVNREEDLGIDGLRRAKLSYHPEILLEKYIAVLK